MSLLCSAPSVLWSHCMMQSYKTKHKNTLWLWRFEVLSWSAHSDAALTTLHSSFCWLQYIGWFAPFLLVFVSSFPESETILRCLLEFLIITAKEKKNMLRWCEGDFKPCDTALITAAASECVWLWRTSSFWKKHSHARLRAEIWSNRVVFLYLCLSARHPLDGQ